MQCAGSCFHMLSHKKIAQVKTSLLNRTQVKLRHFFITQCSCLQLFSKQETPSRAAVHEDTPAADAPRKKCKTLLLRCPAGCFCDVSNAISREAASRQGRRPPATRAAFDTPHTQTCKVLFTLHNNNKPRTHAPHKFSPAAFGEGSRFCSCASRLTGT